MLKFFKHLLSFASEDDTVFDRKENLVEFEKEARGQFLELRQKGLAIPVFTA